MLLPILIYNFTREATKLPWKRSVHVRHSAKMAPKFQNVRNEEKKAHHTLGTAQKRY